VPALTSVPAGFGNAIAFFTESANANITSTFVTQAPTYPSTAVLGVLQSNGTIRFTSLNGTLVGGNYQFTFNDGPVGIAALAFSVPWNAHLGTVSVNSVANQASCKSSTNFTVTSGASKVSDANSAVSAQTLSFTLPGGIGVPASVTTSATAPVHCRITQEAGQTIDTLFVTFPNGLT
jgi:hypothetical protein